MFAGSHAAAKRHGRSCEGWSGKLSREIRKKFRIFSDVDRDPAFMAVVSS
jgi:hypothetical protein